MDFPIIWLINKVISKVGALITILFAWLPDSPFQYDLTDSAAAQWFGYINYVIPVPDIVLHMSLYITAVAIYYVIRIALRWVKAIE